MTRISSYVFVKNDGGRSKSRNKSETNDCTVRSLAIALDLPYDLAHSILKCEGRKNRRGFDLSLLLDRLPKEWYWTSLSFEWFRKPLTLSLFTKLYGRGRYIVEMNDHCCVVIDGVVHDIKNDYVNSEIHSSWLLLKH